MDNKYLLSVGDLLILEDMVGLVVKIGCIDLETSGISFYHQKRVIIDWQKGHVSCQWNYDNLVDWIKCHSVKHISVDSINQRCDLD